MLSRVQNAQPTVALFQHIAFPASRTCSPNDVPSSSATRMPDSSPPRPRRIIPNCVARVKGERAAFVADALLAQSDVSGLSVRRPVDRGQVVNWDLEREIWQRILSHVLRVRPRDCHLILSEPYFHLPALRAAACVTALLELEFRSLVMAPPALLSLRRHARMHPDVAANAAGERVL